MSCSSLSTVSSRFACVADEILARVGVDKHEPPYLSFGEAFSILLSLSNASLHIDRPSGKEAALKNDILSRPLRSVGLEDLFATAYEKYCSKDLECALLTTYNVLEEGRDSSTRENLPLQKRLKIMHPGNNFGAAYHFFGLAYYTMMTNDFAGFIAMHSCQIITYGDIDGVVLPPMDYELVAVNSKGYKLGSKLNDLFLPEFPIPMWNPDAPPVF